MSPLVFFAVLAAAILHALWNALVKNGSDKQTAMGAVALGHAPFAALALIFAPAPDLASVPYIALGIALHFGYQIFLLHSYRHGDLTQVYPIARGSAPLMVAGFSVVVLGVELGTTETLAVLLIGSGILTLGLFRRSQHLNDRRATLLALATGAFIASYSIADGTGARLAGTAVGFYGWLTIGNALCMALYLAARSPQSFTAIIHSQRSLTLVGGGASFTAYALVTWAFTQAPIALVAALRETSIIFAVLIGAVFLKEKIDLAKIASTLLTVCGAIILRFSK